MAGSALASISRSEERQAAACEESSVQIRHSVPDLHGLAFCVGRCGVKPWEREDRHRLRWVNFG